MNKIKMHWFAIFPGLLFSCLVTPNIITTSNTCSSIQDRNNHPKSLVFQELLEKSKENGLTGVSLLIEDGNEGSFYGFTGNADLNESIAIDACKKFRVASITKVFTATAIMLLVERGLITLETPINQILSSEVLKDIKRANEARIKDLLAHKSGIANYDDNPNFPALILNEPGKAISLAEKLDLIRGQGATPAWVVEKFGIIYSNSNYLLLQLILEKVSKVSYEAFIQENILDKLKLSQTTFSTLEPYPENLTLGYVDIYDKGYVRDVSSWDAQRFQGEGCIISNAKELSLFYSALMDGRLFENQGTFDKMQSQGLGILKDTIQETPIIGHDGQAIGYSAEMWYLPQRNCIIVLLANQGRIMEEQPSIKPFENLFEDVIITLEK